MRALCEESEGNAGKFLTCDERRASSYKMLFNELDNDILR
jgi:hypothetical protein